MQKRGLNLWHKKKFFAPTPYVRQPLFETSEFFKAIFSLKATFKAIFSLKGDYIYIYISFFSKVITFLKCSKNTFLNKVLNNPLTAVIVL